eukprot:885820-Ditylum_brightwellii.AAC.1
MFVLDNGDSEGGTDYYGLKMWPIGQCDTRLKEKQEVLKQRINAYICSCGLQVNVHKNVRQ